MSDISIAIVELLLELTDVDIFNESEDGTEVLLDALVSLKILRLLPLSSPDELTIVFAFHLQLECQIVALLVQNLERLDESVKEEADGVHNTLG